MWYISKYLQVMNRSYTAHLLYVVVLRQFNARRMVPMRRLGAIQKPKRIKAQVVRLQAATGQL